MSKLETNTIDTISGASNLTIGSSNASTITLKSGATLTNFPDNTPTFFASNTGNQNASQNTATKLAFSNEVWDVGGVYNNSTYRFTPGFVGKSNISCGFWSYDAQSVIFRHDSMLYKNGSQLTSFENRYTSSNSTMERSYINFNMNVSHDADDYFEMYGLFRTTDSGTADILSSSGSNSQFWNYFTAFKIIE